MGACSQDVGRMPGIAISADVISVAVNAEYSSCQRDICSENLVFRAFLRYHGLKVSLYSVSQPICSCPPVRWRNGALGNVFKFPCT